MRSNLIIPLVLLAAVACQRHHRQLQAADFRERMVRHGFDMGPLTDDVPAELAGVAKGDRLESKCASAKIEGYSLDLCVWRFASMEAATAWIQAHGTDAAIPGGSNRHQYGPLLVIVAPVG